MNIGPDSKRVATMEYIYASAVIECISIPATAVDPYILDDTDMQAVIDFANDHGGELITDIISYKALTYQCMITLICVRKHKFTTKISNLSSWCLICKHLNTILNARAITTEYVSIYSHYHNCDNEFLLECDHNHKFVVRGYRNIRRCPVCDYLRSTYHKHKGEFDVDADSIYKDRTTLMRFHCNKLRHLPECGNTNCTRSSQSELKNHCNECIMNSPCDQDFIATMNQLRKGTYVYNCDHDHRMPRDSQLATTTRIFEIYFGVKFCDYELNTETRFTGYNRMLKLAFVNRYDKTAVKAESSNRVFCRKNKVKYIEIGTKNRCDRDIIHSVITGLVHQGIAGEKTYTECMQTLRTRMNLMQRPFPTLIRKALGVVINRN